MLLICAVLCLFFFNNSILWYSAANGNLRLLKLALALGANSNYQKDSTPLIFAAIFGKDRIDVTEALLKAGSDPNSFFLRSDFTALHHASRCQRDADLVSLLIKYGAKVNVSDKTGNTPLLYALQADHYEIGKVLLENGSDPNSTNLEGNTPLFFAIWNNKKDFVLFLISKGARKLGNDRILGDPISHLKTVGGLEILNTLEKTPGIY